MIEQLKPRGSLPGVFSPPCVKLFGVQAVWGAGPMQFRNFCEIAYPVREVASECRPRAISRKQFCGYSNNNIQTIVCLMIFQYDS